MKKRFTITLNNEMFGRALDEIDDVLIETCDEDVNYSIAVLDRIKEILINNARLVIEE